MRAHLDGYRGGLQVRQFDSGHSNPTFFVSAEMSDGKRRDFVLRKKPPGKLVASAHQVDREFRVISALAETDVPVARARLLCADHSVIGQMFYLMDAVPGPLLIDATHARPDAGRTHGDLQFHERRARPPAQGRSCEGRTGRLRPHRSYIARQVARWSKQYAELKTEDIPAMDKLAEWLPENIPAEDPTTVVHGDYRLGNLIVHPSEPRVVAVLDWELSTLGHPLCDIAYNCLGYHLHRPPHGFAKVDFAKLRLPTETEYVAAYCRRTGRDSHSALELLPRLLAVPAGRHRPGRLPPRPAGQLVNPNSVKMSRSARERAELGVKSGGSYS